VQHETILASLAGNLHGAKAQFSGVHVAENCTPWLRQLWSDIELAASIDDTLRSRIRETGWLKLYECSEFLAFDHRRLPFFSSPCDIHLHLEPEQDEYCFCGHLCHGKQV
jgi:hypothetical protein